MNIKELIKDIRLKAKKTQGEFAESINVSRGTISQIEGGRANPTYEILEKIINVYSIDANVFFKKSIPNYLPKDIPNVNLINKDFEVLLSKNDLKVLNSIPYFPSVSEIEKYLHLSENKIKSLIKDICIDIEKKVQTINLLCELSMMLKLKTKKNLFNQLDSKELINKVLQEYNHKDWDEDFVIESSKLVYIVKLYGLNEEFIQLTYVIDNQINQFYKQCSHDIKIGLINFNNK
jgi:transcriptional regulator with XRE-family HTH domain